MKANRKKIELAMARECLNIAELARKAQMPEPSVKNALYEHSVRPATIGRIARALGVDPVDIIETEE